MQIEVINTLDDIKHLEPEWNKLHDKAQAAIFIHHAWVYENYRCFDSKDILLLAVYDGTRNLVGIFPFAIKVFRIRFMTFRTLTHGGSTVTDYSRFLIDPQANSQLMIRRVLMKLVELQPNSWDLYKFDNLCDGDDTSNLFRYFSLTTLYAGATATDVAPVIRFDQAYRQKKKAAEIKRCFNKIADECELIHHYGTQIDSRMLAEFSELHRRAFPGSAFDAPRAQAFYKALLDKAEIQSNVCLSQIRHGGKLIAAHFGFMDEMAFYYYVPAYDETYSAYGPGQYLLLKLISLGEEKHKQEFDFLRGAERYKFNWTNKITTNYTVIGVDKNAGRIKKAVVNLWLVTRQIPFFNLS